MNGPVRGEERATTAVRRDGGMSREYEEEEEEADGSYRVAGQGGGCIVAQFLFSRGRTLQVHSGEIGDDVRRCARAQHASLRS